MYSAQKDPAMVTQRLHRHITFHMVWPSGKDYEPQDFKDELDMDYLDHRHLNKYLKLNNVNAP